jgi:hypothetical protein
VDHVTSDCALGIEGSELRLLFFDELCLGVVVIGDQEALG